MSRRRSAWLCGLALLLLSGCGGAGAQGSAQRQLSPRARALARAEATHEYPSPTPPAQSAPGSLTAVQAVSAFARLYINWNAQDVSAHMARLARASIGQARSEMALAAAETRTDTTIQQGGISNRGAVETVAPRDGHSGQYVVVTREATSASVTTAYRGLARAWHVTLATVAALGPPGRRRWILSGWQPES